MLYAGQALVHSLASAVQELTASEGANMGQLSHRVVRLGNAMTPAGGISQGSGHLCWREG